MREFLLNYATIILPVIVILEFLLTIFFLGRLGGRKKLVAFCGFVICLGLTYDALVIFLGNFLNPDLILSLSRYRFVLHGLSVPLLILIGADAAELPKAGMIIAGILTVLVMAAGVWAGFQVVLEPSRVAGLYRFVSGKDTPLLAGTIETVLSFGTIIPMLILGLIAIFRRRDGWVFLGGLFMFIFSALGPATHNTDLIFLISMFGELLMVICFYIYTYHRN